MKKTLRYLIILTCLLTTLKCSKKTEIIDFSDIKLTTLQPIDLTSNSIVLQGLVNKLNDIPIVESGFILKKINQDQRINEEEIIKIGSQPQLGLIQYTLKNTHPFELDQRYSFAFYIKTEYGYYKGDFVDFTIEQFQVNPTIISQATIGQKIEVTGDFRFLSKDHVLIPGNLFNNYIIPYSISENKQTLTFTIPNSKEFTHGKKEKFSLRNLKLDNYRDLVEITILGLIHPPQNTTIYTEGPLILKGLAVNNSSYQASPPFYLLFNGHKIPYNEFIYRSDINLPGNTFKIGYHNGRDSIVFEQTIEWENPL